MAGRGPVPKRLEERRRGDRSEGPPLRQAETFPGEISVPPADPDWHPLAKGWYESLETSGQAQWYEPSDYATAYVVAAGINALMVAPRMSASMFAAVMAGMSDLCVTEGARRRARIELQRAKDTPVDNAPVIAMDAYRLAAK